MTSPQSAMDEPNDGADVATVTPPDPATEQLFAELLAQAYPVPPMPKSLAARLDQAVTAEWGHSPGLVVDRPSAVEKMTRAFLSRSGLMQVAVCLSMLFAIMVVFRSSTEAYGWMKMMDAMREQSIVVIGDRNGDTSRWLSMPDSLLGQRSGQTVSLIRPGDRSVIQQRVGETSQKKRALNSGSFPSDQQLAIGFLLGCNVDADANTPVDIPILKVVEESWTKKNGKVQLNVVFSGADSHQFLTAHIEVDPETHLPLSCAISGDDGSREELAVSYPEKTPDTVLAEAVTEARMMASLDSRIPGNSAELANSLPTLKEKSGEISDEEAAMAKLENPENGEAPPAEPFKPAIVGAANMDWKQVPENTADQSKVIAQINQALQKTWAKYELTPVSPAKEAELLRRLYLDLAGRTPTVTEVRDYLNDESDRKYEALIDQLLESRDHATHLATVWRNFLLPEGVDLSNFGGVSSFDEWMADRFASNMPYDQLVRELILAEGRLSKSGPLLFYTSLKLDADQLAGRTARVFLGMRLDCAQCHDDPFEPWTQKDFWSYAAFFARISRPQGELETASRVMRVYDIDRGEVTMPYSEEPVEPRFLDGQEVDQSAQAKPRRHQLAAWMTSPENPYFAKAAVNRAWAHMFGSGIVTPVDGFGVQHAPKSSELLELLAGRFISTGFNFRDLLRIMALSDAYQLSSGAEESNPQRQEYFAQMNVKMLTAEQLYDCITVATMLSGQNPLNSFMDRFGNTPREEFLTQFHSPGAKITDYQGGIPQALTLMNGTLIGSATDLSQSGLLKSIEADFFTDQQRVEILYLATLSRRPTPHEYAVVQEYMDQQTTKESSRKILADVLWAILNSAEFTMNH